jgi:hypothetical protein
MSRNSNSWPKPAPISIAPLRRAAVAHAGDAAAFERFVGRVRAQLELRLIVRRSEDSAIQRTAQL